MFEPVGVSLGDLLLAYRRAKCDAFYERSFVDHGAFAAYERDLEKNLKSLKKKLSDGESVDVGRVSVVPKSLREEPSAGQGAAAESYARSHGVTVFSDPRKAFSFSREERNSPPKLRLSVRPILDASVEFRIIESLWISTCGSALDAWLPSSARANRCVRSGKRSPEATPDLRGFQKHARGSFPPYWRAYQRWRDDGLDSARKLVDAGRTAFVQTLDLRSYYYRADARAVFREPFVRQLLDGADLSRRQSETNEVRRLKSWTRGCTENGLTERILSGYSQWFEAAKEAGLLADGDNLPIPIGCASGRVVANVLLAPLDRLVERDVNPWYYGRYVDDFLLVVDGDAPVDVASLLTKIGVSPEPVGGYADPDVEAGQGLLGETELEFATEKTRSFHLSGESGREALSSMRQAFDRLSSERTLLPGPDLDQWAERIVDLDGAGEAMGGFGPKLREIDAISVRRYALSILAGKLAMVVDSLPDAGFIDGHASRLTELVSAFALSPDKIVEFWDYVPRLIPPLVASGRYSDALRLTKDANDALDELLTELGEYCGPGNAAYSEVLRKRVEAHVRERFERMCATALRRGWAPDLRKPTATESEVLDGDWLDGGRSCFDAGLNIRRPDFLDLSTLAGKRRTTRRFVAFESDPLLRDRLAVLERYAVSDGERGSRSTVLRLATTVRPPAVTDIMARMCSASTNDSATNGSERLSMVEDYVATAVELVRALRGPVLQWRLTPEDDSIRRGFKSSTSTHAAVENLTFKLRGGPELGKIRVAIASVKSDDNAWANSASGDPVDDRKLAEQLRKIQEALRLYGVKPDYLVLPELLLPEALALRFAGLLAQDGTSLITGLLYDARECATCETAWVRNRVLVSMAGGFGAYPHPLTLVRTKARPSRGEGEELRTRFGAEHSASCPTCGGHDGIPLSPDTVFEHGEHAFAVQICSELLDMKYRAPLPGRIDTLFTISWNKDLKVFDPIVEAASWDLHCFSVYCNVQQYGGSRIRAPYAKDYRREVAALRGGTHPYVVVAELPVHDLRAFHSRALPTGSKADFKPTSPEFEVASYRRVSPPGK